MFLKSIDLHSRFLYNLLQFIYKKLSNLTFL